MLEKISKHVTRWLVNKGAITENDFEVYEYGVFQLVMNIVDILTIIALAAYFNEFVAIVCFAISFTALRKYAGGYHSNTVLGCYFITIIATLLTILQIKYVTIPFAVSLGIWAITGVTIVLMVPVSSKNKPLDEVEYIVYRKKALIIWFIECVTLFVLEISGFEECFEGILAGQCYVAIALCIEMIIEENIRKGE